jgi:hypothetical protein
MPCIKTFAYRTVLDGFDPFKRLLLPKRDERTDFLDPSALARVKAISPFSCPW